jgi:chalcone synthase
MVPKIVAEGAAQCLVETFSARYGIKDWNSLFYVVHPGGTGVLNKFEEHIGLTKDKLRASRHVLSEYGNMWGPSVFFVLDEMRRRSAKEGKATTGEGLDLGVLFGFGPGVTIETIVLRSFATD